MIVGTTSWQIPGTYLENLKILKDEVDFVELLIYSWDEHIQSIIKKESEELFNSDIKLSIHLPTDNMKSIRNVCSYFKDFNVYRLTMHPFGEIEEFKDTFRYCQDIFKKRLCVENLEDGKFFEYYNKIKEYNPSITMDWGHLTLLGENPEYFISRVKSKIREIHFHGIQNGKDHSLPTKEQYKSFIKTYKKYFKDTPVCVELFKLEETLQVVEVLKNAK